MKATQNARELARAQLTREIKEEARRQVAAGGAQQLSLRAVARELGMVSSALYRYYPSRDELLTALIIDAYDSLGAAAEAAVAGTTATGTTVAEAAVPGATVAGATATGTTATGTTATGTTVAEAAVPGAAVAGATVAGATVAGATVAGATATGATAADTTAADTTAADTTAADTTAADTTAAETTATDTTAAGTTATGTTVAEATAAETTAAETAVGGATAAGGTSASVRERWRVGCRAVRDWARARPHEYALIYGSPVPGYQAPPQTVAPASRIPVVLGGLLAEVWKDQPEGAWKDQPSEAWKDQPERAAQDQPAQPALPGLLAGQAEFVGAAIAPGVPPPVIANALIAWTQLFGMISFELFGQLVGSADPADDFFSYAVERMADLVGLPG